MMGLSMVSIESIASAKAFKHKVNFEILNGLVRGCIIALIVYLILKIYFLATGPGIGAAFAGTTEANMYLLEMIGGIIVPLAILAGRNKKAESVSGMMTGHLLVVGGVLLNRLNVSISGVYGFQSAMGGSYSPSTIEFLITLAIVALGIFLFKLWAKFLPLFPEAKVDY
jgi:Ni/Fe-hydrogenase subunit HybB-like protein